MILKVFEHTKDNFLKEIVLEKGYFNLYETKIYHFEIHSKNSNLEYLDIFLEDEVIAEDKIEIREESLIKTSSSRYFVDFFGYSNIKIDKEEFPIKVYSSKVTALETEKMLIYIYLRNNDEISKFYSKSIYNSGFKDKSKNNITIKKLHLIKNFILKFEHIFKDFKYKPHSNIRKKLVISSFENSLITNKSIEWLLSNLDSIKFAPEFDGLDDSFEIEGKYGLIENIASERNDINYSTYENEIILGTFEYVSQLLDELNKYIVSKIKKEVDEEFEIEFSIEKVYSRIFKNALIEIESLRKRNIILFNNYKNIFKNTKKLNITPKLTHVFNKVTHYKTAFEEISKIRSYEISFKGEDILFNLKRLSEIYEYYNYHLLKDILTEILLPLGFEINVSSEKVSFINSLENKTINFIYEPVINRDSENIDLIKLGGIKENKKFDYYKPDFLLELVSENQKRYCIFDAKFKPTKTIIENDIKEVSFKYLLLSGIKNELYKKPDFLWVIYPGFFERKTIYKLTNNTNYFPIIGIVTSKPDYEEPLKKILFEIFKVWGVSN